MYICPCYTVIKGCQIFSPPLWPRPLATPKPNNRSTRLQPLHSTLIYSARPHENNLQWKKLMLQFWAPTGPRAPRIAGSTGSVVTPLLLNKIHVQTNTKSVQCLCINMKHNKVRITQTHWTSRKHAYWRKLQGLSGKWKWGRQMARPWKPPAWCKILGHNS